MLRKTLIVAATLIVVAVIIAFAFGPGYLEKGINRVIDHEAYEISEEARALHASLTGGGLIGIGYWDGAVCDATPAGVAKSIKYTVNLVGREHVALGIALRSLAGGRDFLRLASESRLLTEQALDHFLERDKTG